MPQKNVRKELSLKWLELFQICAQKGSLQTAAKEAGLTVSTVSHHLRSLEDHLGVELFNHSRRPMVLTQKGQIFLRNIDDALYAIRKAAAEASTSSISGASYLRLGTVEDFDSDISPELAAYLLESMPHCDFLYHTASSHTLIEMMRNRQLDLGIASNPTEQFRDLQERQLLQDPYVLVLPLDIEQSISDIFEGQTKLPFLRFSSDLIIARQIESQLRRLGVSSPPKFECSNNQTLMAMVAAGAGWTISTPLLFSRAKRFHPKLRMHRFPSKGFGRTLALMKTPDCSQSLFELVDDKVRTLMSTHAIAPIHKSYPWLADSFKLIS